MNIDESVENRIEKTIFGAKESDTDSGISWNFAAIHMQDIEKSENKASQILCESLCVNYGTLEESQDTGESFKDHPVGQWKDRIFLWIYERCQGVRKEPGRKDRRPLPENHLATKKRGIQKNVSPMTIDSQKT